jgi:hypothetical protein
MKKTAYSILAALAALPLATHAQTTIADWTFETHVPPSLTNQSFSGLLPDIGSGSASGLHASNPTHYGSVVGNGSAHALSSDNWRDGDYWQFQVSTLGFRNITVSYDQASNTNGPRLMHLEYSLNGTTFSILKAGNNILPDASPNPIWNSTTPSSVYTFSNDFSSTFALDDASTLYFRLADDSSGLSAGGGPVSPSGVNFVDNFTVIGVVPEPQQLFVVAGLGALAWSLVRRRKGAYGA